MAACRPSCQLSVKIPARKQLLRLHVYWGVERIPPRRLLGLVGPPLSVPDHRPLESDKLVEMFSTFWLISCLTDTPSCAAQLCDKLVPRRAIPAIAQYCTHNSSLQNQAFASSSLAR